MEGVLCEIVESPLGPIRLLGDERALWRLDFVAEGETAPEGTEPSPGFGGFAGRLRAYFGGELTALDGIPAAPAGTEFQQRVWRELRSVQPGETLSYRELAARAGSPKASRAVGAAVGRNPVALVIPCHRIVGADGGLTGYAYGLDRKRSLLVHEGALS